MPDADLVLPLIPNPPRRENITSILSNAYCLLPIAYCLLPITYYLLPITYCLLPIAFCLPSPNKNPYLNIFNLMLQEFPILVVRSR